MNSPAFERVGSDIVLRAFSISMVVYHHIVLYNGGDTRHALFGVHIAGGMGLLLLLSGFSFARFGLYDRSPGEARAAIFSTAKAIVVPCFVAGLFFMLVARRFNLYEVLYIGNFFPGNWQAGFNTWYPQVLLQIFLFVILLYSVRPLADWMARRPRHAAVLLLGLSLVILVATRQSPLWFISSAKAPWLYMWNFVLGWALFFLTRTGDAPSGGRIFASLLCAIVVAVALDLESTRAWAMLVGGLVLIWAPSLRLPKGLVRTCLILSQASLTIFIFHMSALKLYGGVFGRPATSFGVELILVMAGLVGAWLVVTSALRALRYLKLQQGAAGQAVGFLNR